MAWTCSQPWKEHGLEITSSEDPLFYNCIISSKLESSAEIWIAPTDLWGHSRNGVSGSTFYVVVIIHIFLSQLSDCGESVAYFCETRNHENVDIMIENFLGSLKNEIRYLQKNSFFTLNFSRMQFFSQKSTSLPSLP